MFSILKQTEASFFLQLPLLSCSNLFRREDFLLLDQFQRPLLSMHAFEFTARDENAKSEKEICEKLWRKNKS